MYIYIYSRRIEENGDYSTYSNNIAGNVQFNKERKVSNV